MLCRCAAFSVFECVCLCSVIFDLDPACKCLYFITICAFKTIMAIFNFHSTNYCHLYSLMLRRCRRRRRRRHICTGCIHLRPLFSICILTHPTLIFMFFNGQQRLCGRAFEWIGCVCVSLSAFVFVCVC